MLPRHSLCKDGYYFTKEETNTVDILDQKSGKIVSRDEIAQAVWGKKWLEKYSDWQIDRLIYLVRNKLVSSYKIKTVRNSGYILESGGITIRHMATPKVPGTHPTGPYLEYMNNPQNLRKVLKDLFSALGSNKDKYNSVLVINSYSMDNVNSVNKWLTQNDCEVYFINFDENALKIHRDRIESLKLDRYHVIYDDIRNSMLRNSSFDLIINDFRLNFNTSHKQNIQAITNMYRLLKPRGKAIVSVVVDPRYESKRFGDNQEKAPTNKDKPWHFEAQEGLKRDCFTVPYYKRLYAQSGFKLIKEFDILKGKRWNPPYRRFVLAK